MPKLTDPSPAGVILPIQYLRGIAAMMVVLHHTAGQVEPIQRFLNLPPFGAHGVDLFFVISGFIMVATTQGTKTTPWQFMRRRIIRVVPLYWILTIAMVVAWLLAPSVFKTLRVTPEKLVQSLLFIPHFSSSFPAEVFPLLVPGWTLNFEMYFYALFALLLLLPDGLRVHALVAFLLSSVALGYALGPLQSAAGRTYTSLMLLEFASGAMIGQAWCASRISVPIWASFLMIAIGFALIVSAGFEPTGVLSALLGASLVVTGALHPRMQRLQSSWLLKLGDSSYSLYLTHIFTLAAFRIVWVYIFPGEPDWPVAAGFLVAALVVCAFVGYQSYLWIERPTQRWLNKLTARSIAVRCR